MCLECESVKCQIKEKSAMVDLQQEPAAAPSDCEASWHHAAFYRKRLCTQHSFIAINCSFSLIISIKEWLSCAWCQTQTSKAAESDWPQKLQSQIRQITLLQRSTLQLTDQIQREALTQASAVFMENPVRKCVYDEIKSQNRLQHRYFSEIFERNVTEACASAETGSLESTIRGQNALSCSRQTR